MAFPIGDITTTAAGDLGNTIKSFYERAMLEWMVPQYRFYSFAKKVALPKMEGSSVIWNRKVAFRPGYRVTQGSPMSAVKNLSTNKVSALIEQLSDVVAVSDLARLQSVVDTDAYAYEVMADQAAKSVEIYIINNLVADSVVNHYVKKSGSVLNSNSAAVSATGSLPRLALSDIRTAVTKLRSFNAPYFEGQTFVGIIHPKQLQSLYDDSSYTNWMQYTTSKPMTDYEVGQVFGVRIMTSTLVPASVGSTNGFAVSGTGIATLAYGMTIFGKDAFGVTELDGGIKTYSSKGASKADPNNLSDVYAWKANLASKVLNPSAVTFIWSGVGDTVACVCLASAVYDAGITCDMNILPSW